MKVGDRVRVKEDVWDDGREKSWYGWEGIVKAVTPDKSTYHGRRYANTYPIFVFFRKARGRHRHFDFDEWELEKL